MKNNYFFTTLWSAVLLAWASLPAFSQTYDNGIFVLNEGGAGSGNATVSFINSQNTVTNNIYGVANPQQTLGDTGQSISFHEDKAYVVLNISNTVKIVNRNTFAHIATVSTGLSNPRYMAFANGKGYVSNWGDGGSTSDDYLAVLDLNSHTVTGTIPLAEGVERMLTLNGKIYVAHQGGYGYGNTISVINPATDVLETTIAVGDVPNRMVEHDGFLYVLCGGRPMWGPPETDGSLVKIDLSNNSVVATTPFAGKHPNNLQINANGTLFFTDASEVYQSTVTDPSTFTQIISLAAQGVYGIYGMDLIDDQLYVADAGNYVAPGKAYVYSSAGTLLQNYTVGVIPNSFYKAEANLSVPEFATQTIKIYPNPTFDQFYVNAEVGSEVKLFDTTGRLVATNKVSTEAISVQQLPAGIYLIQVMEAGKIKTGKLVKQ